MDYRFLNGLLRACLLFRRCFGDETGLASGAALATGRVAGVEVAKVLAAGAATLTGDAPADRADLTTGFAVSIGAERCRVAGAFLDFLIAGCSDFSSDVDSVAAVPFRFDGVRVRRVGTTTNQPAEEPGFKDVTGVASIIPVTGPVRLIQRVFFAMPSLLGLSATTASRIASMPT